MSSDQTSSRRLARAARLLCLLLLVPLQAAPARAVLAGDNGDFVVVQEITERNQDLDILRISADGEEAINLTESGLVQNTPAWSPDGRRIAYQSGFALVVIDKDGSGPKVLVSAGSSWFPRQPAWSPDGTEIAYARVYWDSDGNLTRGAIHVLDLATGKSRYVAPSGINNTEIDWSPDGKRLVFQHWRWVADYEAYGSDVMVVNSDGNQLTDLSSLTGGSYRDWRPSWTRDGRIVFHRRATPCTIRFPICNGGFYAVNPDGSGLELLPLGPRDWTGDGVVDRVDRLRQSPDGSAWGLLVYDASAGSHQLWSVDEHFAAERKLFAPIFWFFDWQPRCSVQGSPQDDELVGTSAPDLICGLGGNDVIKGRGGNDVIFGHGGSDRIIGGPGRDIVVGNAGRDRCDRDEKDYSHVC